MILIRSFPQPVAVDILVGIINLDGIYSRQVAQVGLYTFAFITTCGTPIGFHDLIHGVIRNKASQCRRDLHRLIIIQQHPSCERRSLPVLCISESSRDRARYKMRIIDKSSVAKHHSVRIKSGWPYTKPAFESIFNGYYRS